MNSNSIVNLMNSGFSDPDLKMNDLVVEIGRNFVRDNDPIVQKISPVETFICKIQNCNYEFEEHHRESLDKDIEHINFDNYEEVLKNVFYKYIFLWLVFKFCE